MRDERRFDVDAKSALVERVWCGLHATENCRVGIIDNSRGSQCTYVSRISEDIVGRATSGEFSGGAVKRLVRAWLVVAVLAKTCQYTYNEGAVKRHTKDLLKASRSLRVETACQALGVSHVPRREGQCLEHNFDRVELQIRDGASNIAFELNTHKGLEIAENVDVKPKEVPGLELDKAIELDDLARHDASVVVQRGL